MIFMSFVMSLLVIFWLGLGNLRHIATKSQHLWTVSRQIKFWSILKKKKLMLCHTWSSQPPCLGLNLTTVPSPGPGCLTLPLWGNGSEQNINDQTSPVYMRSACPNVLINRLARSLAVVIWGETNPSTFAQIKPHPLTWCHSPALARVWNKCSMFKRGDQRTRCKRWPNWCHNHLKQAVRVVENT